MKKIKKICAGLISAAVLTASMVTGSSAVLLGGLGGDANGDGVVNLIDMSVIYGYISNPENQINFDNADVNTDGYVTVIDYFMLGWHLNGSDNKGDVNSDGAIDSLDFAIMTRFLNRQPLSYFQYFNGDIDNDGYVTLLDWNLLRDMILEV